MAERGSIPGLFGVPIKLSLGTFFLIALVAFTGYSILTDSFGDTSQTVRVVGGIAMGIGLVLSVIFHEYAHVLVARIYGIETSHISVWFLGGVAHLKEEAKSPGAEFWSSVVGPLSSLFLTLFFGAAAFVIQITTGLSFIATIIVYLALINLLLAVFNMLPMYPMDGGRVLKSILWKITGKLTLSRQITAWVSVVLSVIGVVFAIWTARYFMAAVFAFIALQASYEARSAGRKTRE